MCIRDSYLNAQIDGESVSFGGSMTLSQMGLFESLGKHNKMFKMCIRDRSSALPPSSSAR